jgi:hypothetical protein
MGRSGGNVTQPGMPDEPVANLGMLAGVERDGVWRLRVAGAVEIDHHAHKTAVSGDVARSFRDHVARCSDMMSPA